MSPSANVVWGGVRQTGHGHSGSGESHEEVKFPFREEEFFRIPPLKLPKRSRGWSQERPCKIPALSERGKPDRPIIQPPRTEQSRTTDLELTPNVVNCPKEIIICHHILSLSVALPSIKRGIVTNLHAGRIKEFKENWAILTQDPWVLQTVQGFQLPLLGQPVQTAVPSQLQLSLVQQELVSI